MMIASGNDAFQVHCKVDEKHEMTRDICTSQRTGLSLVCIEILAQMKSPHCNIPCYPSPREMLAHNVSSSKNATHANLIYTTPPPTS